MIVSDVIKRVQRQFGDESAVQIEEADIIRWINDATREISSQNDLTQATGTMSSVAGQDTYAFPSDMMAIRTMYYDDIKIDFLKKTDYDGVVNKTDGGDMQSGTPYMFTRWGSNFILYPKPDSIKEIKLFYLQRPVDVTTTADTVPLPIEYHNRVVEYCLQQAYQTDEDWEAATQMGGQFSDGITRLKEHETANEIEYYPTITVLPDDL